MKQHKKGMKDMHDAMKNEGVNELSDDECGMVAGGDYWLGNDGKWYVGYRNSTGLHINGKSKTSGYSSETAAKIASLWFYGNKKRLK